MGKTPNSAATSSLARKHPHGRGEDISCGLSKQKVVETPPRAWGRPRRLHTAIYWRRNTPTGVGKTGHIRSTPLAPEIRGASAPGARKRDASSTPLPLVPGDFSGAGLPLLSVRKYPFAGDSICCVDCYRFQACNAGYAVRTAIGGTCSEPTARHTPGCPD